MNRRRAVLLALLLILALAAFLRFYRIDSQSLWNDEGTSATLALRSLADITESAARDIHPPLYYWLLHFWVKGFGTSELALRSLSALLGVALVLLVYMTGDSLFGTEVGLLAAFFSAISPFQVYYSQETRMYMLLALIVALGAYALARFTQGEASREGSRPWRDWAVWAATYALSVALGLYTHYSFPVLWAVWNLAYLAYWLWSHRGFSRLLRWIAIQAVALVLYLPWLPAGLRQMAQWPSISEAHSLPFFIKDALQLFIGGHTLEIARTDLLILLAAVGVVGFAGILPRKGDRNTLPWWLRTGLIAAWCALPVAAQWALSLWRPSYRPKFFLAAAPAFALLVARGALWPSQNGASRPFGRIWSHVWLLLSTLLICGMGVQALNNYYYDSAYARDDYRGIAQYVEAFGGPDDAVLINAPSQVETFDLYYKGDTPVYPLPQQRPMDRAATERELEAMVADRNRVFAIFWATDESDPDRFIESWMDTRAFKASDDWYGNVRFVVYAVPQSPMIDIAHPMEVRLGESIQLEGYTLLSEEVPSGGIVQVTLFWKALAPLAARYKVFVHLTDAGGRVVGQRDAEPGGGLRLTTTWQPGDRIADNYGVPVPPGTPPGEYRLVVGMYGMDDGARLPVVREGAPRGDSLALDPIRVSRPERQPPLAAIPMQKRLSARFGPLELGGVDVSRLGYEGQDVDLHPGDVVHLTLFWRAAETPTAEYEITIGDKGASLSVTGQPADGRYPTSQWAAGEVVRDDRYLFVPADQPPGRYDLYVSARALPDGKWEPAVLLCAITLVR